MITRDPADTVAGTEPVTWAAGELAAALGAGAAGRRVLLSGPDTPEARAILAREGVALPDAPESLALVRSGDTILAAGSDTRGLVYAVLELADRVRHADDPESTLRLERPVVEQPANRIRSIARLFTSEVEDKQWWYDRDFWQRYLTELATHRFNRFCLTLGLGYNFPRGVTDDYLHFAYPFLLDVPGYRVRARGVPDEERAANLETLRFIGEQVKRRGLHFQLGLWTHAYRWEDSPQGVHVIEGLDDETHAPYCRDALRLLLAAVPTIDGLTFRVHGESGIPEGSHDFWRTVFDGVVQAARQRGRPLEIDMHAKGVDQETIEVALATGLPIKLSPKYWAEHQGLPYHQAAIREIERTAPPRRGHMAISSGERRHSRYGYSDLLREDRAYGLFFRIWPGTQRLLLWGDPVFAAGYGRHASFAGCRGVELCEPLTFKGRLGSGTTGNRTGYADESLAPPQDWEKYRYTYRVWGRGTYDPEADPDGWRRYTRRAFGAAADDAAAALAHASRICLLITTAYGPSANCKIYWPELYTSLPLVTEEGHPYSDTLRPRRAGHASALDPALFAGMDEFAAEALSDERSGRYSPLDVARWLDGLAAAAERHWAAAETKIAGNGGAEFRRWAADVAIQAALGRFFARKLRAGVAYALFGRTGDPAALREALDEYRAARDAWANAAAHGRVYRDDLTFGTEPWQRGHWRDRLPAIDADIAAIEGILGEAERRTLPPARRAPSLARLAADLAPPSHASHASPVRIDHVPPAAFVRGAALSLAITVAAPSGGGTAPPVTSVQLRYRHTNQAETYEAVEMRPDGDGRQIAAAAGVVTYRAIIPSAYTESPYPLVYFFRLRDASGRAWLYPGFDATLANQPYYLIQQ